MGSAEIEVRGAAITKQCMRCEGRGGKTKTAGVVKVLRESGFPRRVTRFEKNGNNQAEKDE